MVENQRLEVSQLSGNVVDFAQVPLQLGDYFQIRLAANHEGCTVQLIGCLKNFSLLVTAPVLSQAQQLYVQDNQQVTVRYFNGEQAYTFNSYIMRMCQLPYPYLHLSIPRQVQVTQVRQTTRVKINLPAQLICQQYAPADCLITDISISGMSVESTFCQAELGDILQISFCVQLLQTPSIITILGEVRSRNEYAVDNHLPSTSFHYGVAFNALPPEQASIIQNIMYQSLDVYRWLEPPSLAYTV